MTRCPFHDDRNPSFFIFPNGRWRCFGCQASGDAVALVARLTGLKPMEAARAIARDFGLQVDGPEDPEARRKAEEARKRREDEQALKLRVDRAYQALALLHRTVLRAVDSLEAAEALAGWLHEMPLIETTLDELRARDPKRQRVVLDMAEGRWMA